MPGGLQKHVLCTHLNKFYSLHETYLASYVEWAEIKHKIAQAWN